MYIVDLANGWAAANTTPVYEDGSDPGYAERQVFENDGAVVERFSPNAYAISAEREKGNCVADGEAGWFRLMPRWFLKDANAETFIPVWSSSNHILPTGTFLQPIGYIFDNDENILNLPIPLPYELNWLDIREMLTTEWQSKTGGWLEIWIPNTAAFSPTATYPYTYDQGWLAYSYQTASSASVGANWSVLTAAHREVGTLIAD